MSTIHYNGICIPENYHFGYDAEQGGVTTAPYLLPPSKGGYAPETICVDIGRQLFVDDFLIEKSDGLQRIFYAAQKAPDPVLVPETEWELTYNPSTACTSGGIWYDESEQIYKMWYEAGFNNRLAYATSKDGIHWERPVLQPTGNNLLIPEQCTDSFSVWIDHNAPVDERYRLMIRSPNTKECCKFPAIMYRSGDGIHWQVIGETGTMEDRSTFFYDPFRKKWVFSIRSAAVVRWGEEQYRPRLRLYHDGDKFEQAGKWEEEEPLLWLRTDGLDRKDLSVSNEIPQLYNFDAIAYESVMLGMFQIWYGPHNDEIVKTGKPKITDLQVSFSRDGFYFDRPNRQAFIGASRDYGRWDYGYLQSATGGIVVYDNQLRIYYSGFSGQCRQGERSWRGEYVGGAVGYATLRRDGFASMSGSGVLETKPLTVQKPIRYLFVNADASAGSLRAELLDRDGKPLQGYTAEDCVPVMENSTKLRLQWRGGEDVALLQNQPFRIRFLIDHAHLFAFWLSPGEDGASGGAMAAGYAGKMKMQ